MDTDFVEISIMDSDKRRVKGWANVDVKDLGGDAIPTDVMNNGMLDFIEIIGGNIFFKHLNKPVGRVLQWGPKINKMAGKPGIEMIVQFFKGYLLHDIIWNAVKKKILKGFSIGADVPNPKINIIQQDGKNIPKVININEISAVFDPMNTYATIDEIASMAKSVGGPTGDIINQFLDELKKAIDGGCGTDNCSTKCGRCKSMKKGLDTGKLLEDEQKVQEVPPDVKRLIEMYGEDSASKLLEIIGVSDAVKLLPDEDEQLSKGIRVEMEHTDDPTVAKKIAEDHLQEDSEYYTKLNSLDLSKACDGDTYHGKEEETASKEKTNEGIYDGMADEGEIKTSAKLESDITQITKAKTYIENPGQAPEGVSVQTGARGGIYYETTESGNVSGKAAQKIQDMEDSGVDPEKINEFRQWAERQAGDTKTETSKPEPKKVVPPKPAPKKTPEKKAPEKKAPSALKGIPKLGAGPKSTGSQSRRSWFERMQSRSTNKELQKDVGYNAVSPLYLVDNLFAQPDPDKHHLKKAIIQCKPFMDMDPEATEMLEDIFYYIYEGAMDDARRLWDRFKVIYSPALPVNMEMMARSEANNLRTNRQMSVVKSLTKELQSAVNTKKLEGMIKEVRELRKSRA